MKNLNFLSNLCGLRRASQSSDVGYDCRSTVVRPSFDCRSTLLKLVTVLVLILTIGSGNVWADYTIVFKDGSGTSPIDASTLSNFINSGASYVTSASSSYMYPSATTGYGIRLASGSYAGNLTLNLSATGQIKASKITFNAAYYGSDASTMPYTITYTDNTTTEGTISTLSTSLADKEVSLTSTKTIKTIYIGTTAKKKRVYVHSIAVTAAAAATPTITPSVSELDWGTVAKGASLTTKTFTITGTNLTSAALVYSASGGYSVSPSGKAGAAGTLSSQTLTVTPPSTATPGTYNSTVSITGGGLASAVTVNVKLKVENTDTFIDEVHSTAGYTSASPHVEVGSYGTTPSITDKATLTSGTCEQVHYHFVGWITSTKYEAGTSIAVGDLQTPTSATGATYYAVWAKQGAGSGTATGGITQSEITTAADGKTAGTYANQSASSASGNWTGKYAWNTQNSKKVMQINATSGNSIISPTFSGAISNIAFVYTNAAGSNRTFTLKDGATSIGTITASSSTTEGSGSASISGTHTSFEITASAALYIHSITVTYSSVSYEDYIAKCAISHTVSQAVSPAGKATVTLGATTVAEGGTTTATYSAITTGYEFVNWTISGTGATLSSTTANPTTITMGTANVTVTANLQCITPSISVHPASKTDYIVGDVATALSVTANAGGASLSYQWQVSNNNSDWSNIAAGDGGTAATYTPSTAAAGTKYYRVKVTNAATGCSTNATSNAATITVTAASGYCISAFNSSNNGITSGFSNGGSGNEYTLNYTIPGKDGSSNWPQYWIGENEAWASFSANALFADMHFTHSDATLGLAEGATGKLHIWDDNKASGSNLWVKFEPDGYGFRWGGAGEWDQAANTKAFTVDPGNANTYWTEIVTLDGTNNTTWNYYVGLQSASGYVYSGVDNEASDSRGISRTRSVTTMKVSNGTAGSYKATYLNSEATGTRGKFRIWDNNISDYNFVCHFVPYYRVTYNGSGASGSTAASADVCCEGNAAARTVVAAANGFTVPTGKTFGGWASSPENAAAGVVAYAAGANVVLTSSITLYAIWTDINYTVTVNQNPSVGATTTGQTTTAHYNGTINLTTTVPSGYRFVNWTTSDGFSITNPTSATTASFTMPNKNVTVTANFQQTHTVDWYVGGSAPANKIGGDGQTTVVDHGGKISDFPAHDPDGSACDKTFVGWTNTSSYVHGTSPLFNDVAGSPTINANASFYAVFAEVNSVSASLTKMTADDDLEVGDKIVIIAQDTRYGMYQASASSYVSYWTTADGDGEPSLSEIEADDKKYLDVAAGSASNTLKLGDATNGYLYNASSTNLEFSTTNSSDLTLITWTDDSFTFVAGQEVSCRTDITGANANKWRGAGASCDPETGDNCSGTPYYYLYKYVPSSTTATGHTIICADCGTSVTPTYTAAPTGGTVSVTKSAAAVASGSTVKTCTSVDLTVTITPASHYTLTGFTATGLSTGTATISPAVNTVVPTTSAQTFTVTVSEGATGTLNLTPTLEEDAHKVISWVVHGGSASIADGHGTTWVYSGENLTAIPFPAPSAPAGCDDKVFVGWSENDEGATEEDASYYDDLFTTLGEAPTGITTDKTFTAVFATPAAGLGGTVMWDEPWTGESDDATPSSQSASATVYNSTTLTYTYSTSTRVKTDGPYAGGTSPELLVKESGGYFTASNIPTAGQTSLTLTYKSNKSLTVSTNTSGVTVGDADVDGSTYTQTITIDQSGLGVANFDLVFTKTAKSNARLDDIHLVVPGSSSMSGYVTTCEDTWTVTYYKNTEDAVTNLPSPTGISKSTGSGTLSSKVPVRYGYTFDGWATSAGGSVVYAAGAAVSSVSADMDLYAKWSVTPVTEINLSKTSLDKYVGDPSVTLSVLSVLPDGANTSVTWSSSNPSVAMVNSTTGEVNFVAEGTANIIATSTITSGTTATCAVTVWAKPTVSFLDNLHSLTEDKDGNALSGYNLTDVAGTPVVFPILANQSAGSGTCEDEHYVFVGWTTSDNNTDPEDHLVTSHNLTNGDNITYYAVWADGVSGTTYTKLTSSTFKTSPAKYVIGAEYNGTTRYFYSCEKTDKNNSWGYVTADLASNTPIEFTLSGTAAALVATSTEVSARYLKPLATKDFQLSASSQTVELKSDGTIYNNNVDETDWRLLYNMAGGLRWYSSTVSGSASAYFYEVVAGGEVNYRTSCCADKVSAPIVTATKTSTTVTLTWAAVSGATGYELQWNGGAWTAATSGVVKSDLTPNTNYSWRVRATYVPPKCGADIASGSTTTNQVYHVTYAGGSGTGTCNATGSTTDATAYEAGATVTLQSNGFTLVGHTFNEWTEDDEDITISSNQFTMPEHDVVITATWTPKVDKFYDRMHDGTDASHGGIADGDGKYYITREGCSYTVPSLTDNTSGATACHTKHYVLMGWTAESHLNSDGTLKTGHEGYVYTGGGTQTATGATYYAVWAEVEE